jgi:hypothetical protein
MQSKKAVKSNTLRVRLSDHEMSKLESYAKNHEWTISHVIREYIRRLPNSNEG